MTFFTDILFSILSSFLPLIIQIILSIFTGGAAATV